MKAHSLSPTTIVSPGLRSVPVWHRITSSFHRQSSSLVRPQMGQGVRRPDCVNLPITPAPVLLKEGVITEQLCRHAINPWPSGTAGAEGRCTAGSAPAQMCVLMLLPRPISDGLQMDPCGVRIGPDSGSVGCLGWHDSGVDYSIAVAGGGVPFLQISPGVRLHLPGPFSGYTPVASRPRSRLRPALSCGW